MPRPLRSCSAWIALLLIILGNLLPMSTVMASSLTEQADVCSINPASGSRPAIPTHEHCGYCTICQALVLDLPGSEPTPHIANLRYYMTRSTSLLTVVVQRYADPWTRAPPG